MTERKRLAFAAAVIVCVIGSTPSAQTPQCDTLWATLSAKIDALKSRSTLSDRNAVKAARDAYNAARCRVLEPPPPPPPPPQYYVVSLAAAPLSIVSGSAATLTATVTSMNFAPPPTAFAWDCTNDGQIDFTTAANTQACAYTTVGTATARVTASNGGISGTATTPVTVTAVPPPPPPPPDGSGTLVPAGGDLQKAVDAAAPGATLLLEQGAIYTLNLVLRNKTGTGTITIRTAGLTDTELPPGKRIQPFLADGTTPNPLITKLAKLKCLDCFKPTITGEPGAHDYTLIGLDCLPNVTHPDRWHIFLGLNPVDDTLYKSYEAQPQRITLDRLYIHADPALGGRGGVFLDGYDLTLRKSDVRGFWWQGQDSQAVGAVQAHGPITIDDNYLEASGENFLVGGADPSIPNAVPADITFINNYVFKPLSWKTAHPGSVKNLFELKNARRVLIANNVFENNWVDGQPGNAILFTIRNQDGGCPWCVVEDVLFTNNVVKNGGIFNVSILGTDYTHPSGTAAKIRLVNNLFLGAQRGVLLQVPIAGFELVHNTFAGITGSFLSLDSTLTPTIKGTGVIVRDNVTGGGLYGVNSGPTSGGVPTLNLFLDAYTFSGNIIEGNVERVIPYPPGNVTLAPGTLAGKLDARMRYLGSELASDGTKPGADVEAILKAIPWLTWP